MENVQELIESLSETYLWEVIPANLENPKLLADMLSDIGYLENKDETLAMVDSCEISDCEQPEISDVKSEDGKAVFSFEMPFVMIAKKGKEQLLRITATASGKGSIPEAFAWDDFEWDDMNRTQILEHKDLAEISELGFLDVEADDLTA